jgi:hypothetical protein
MSDYARQNDGATHWTDRDGRTTGDADKAVVGAHFDTEFNAILTAVNSKYDSTDIASQAQAEGETLNTKVMTPLAVSYWADNEAGAVGDIQDFTVAGFSAADAIFGWDDSAVAAIGFTIGSGLATIAGSLEISHLGFEDLADPAVDALSGWDDTLGYFTWWTAADGCEFTNAAGTFGLVDVAASSTLPFSITAGTFAWDMSSLTEIGGADLTQAADGVVMSDAGVITVMPIDEMGWPVVSTDADENLQQADMSTIKVNASTAERTWTIRIDATDAGREIGAGIIIQNNGATDNLIIQAATGVTLETRYHAGGVDNASDVVRPGGSAVLYKTAADTWVMTGDILDS